MNNRTIHCIRRVRFSLIPLLLAAAALPISGAVASGVPSAGGDSLALPTVKVLTGNSVPVVTSSKVKLLLSIQVSNLSLSAGDASVAVTLGTRASAPLESYTWTFNEAENSYVVESNGNATVNVPSKVINPYGQISLDFKKTSSTAQNCSSGSGTTESGVLSGSLRLNTNSYRKVNGHETAIWGTVIEKAIKFGAGGTAASLTISQGCQPVIPTPTCAAGISWYSPNFIFSGNTVQGQKRGSLTAFVSSTLKVPEGSAARSGFLEDLSPPQSFSGDKLKIATGMTGEGATSGSANMTYAGPVVDPFSSPCESGKTIKQEAIRTYTGPFTWVNGAKPLTASFALGEIVHVANVSKVNDATVTVTTVS